MDLDIPICRYQDHSDPIWQRFEILRRIRLICGWGQGGLVIRIILIWITSFEITALGDQVIEVQLCKCDHRSVAFCMTATGEVMKGEVMRPRWPETDLCGVGYVTNNIKWTLVKLGDGRKTYDRIEALLMIFLRENGINGSNRSFSFVLSPYIFWGGDSSISRVILQ